MYNDTNVPTTIDTTDNMPSNTSKTNKAANAQQVTTKVIITSKTNRDRKTYLDAQGNKVIETITTTIRVEAPKTIK